MAGLLAVAAFVGFFLITSAVLAAWSAGLTLREYINWLLSDEYPWH